MSLSYILWLDFGCADIFRMLLGLRRSEQETAEKKMDCSVARSQIVVFSAIGAFGIERYLRY